MGILCLERRRKLVLRLERKKKVGVGPSYCRRRYDGFINLKLE